MTATRTRRSVLTGALWLLAGCSRAGYQGPERQVTIAAGESGGFYLEFARLLADQVTRAEPRLRCSAVSTEASVANIHAVRAGSADLGLALADVAEAAVAGDWPFPRPVPLRAVGRVYENYLQLLVRSDGPIRSVADLEGRRVSLGASGSGAAVTGARLMRAAGVRPRTEHRGLADAVAALRDGSIDGLLWSGGVPTPAIAGLSESTPLVLLPLDDELPAMRSTYGPVYAQVRVPADAYPRVSGHSTIGVANLLVCGSELPGDVAGAVARVLATRAADLVPPQAAGTQYLDVRTLIGTASLPLHEGAASAYRTLHG
ncbi:TAXI family TRAP transporter solute-binding subunit [Amycolatopsis palatopharyngis]|uniref:TAXI family TRAP transporter solute-binding subunit n=1 Tax=Amycolatopsis palatopharyngis TaxID=187982 RepID=UPI000E2373EF|nr:TAXI family TRAP transporter solute-binding subunit [Amycolatopsis palatopharyngis]